MDQRIRSAREGCRWVLPERFVVLHDSLNIHRHKVSTELSSAGTCPGGRPFPAGQHCRGIAQVFLPEVSSMIPKGSDMDSLQREFCLYQIEDIPSDNMNMDRADNQWNEIGKTADASGNLKFCNLAAFMKNILSINHSNASCERVFSMARKNKTDFRSTMGNKCLESLLILKQAGGECHKMSVPLNLVKKCKSATKNALSKSDDCDSCDRWILLFVVTWNAMTFDVFEWPMPSAIPLLWILCPLKLWYDVCH